MVKPRNRSAASSPVRPAPVTAQHRLHPGSDLPGTERLGHVVISADAGADESVDLLRPCRAQDDVGVTEGPQLP
jgi:hypothetical protein